MQIFGVGLVKNGCGQSGGKTLKLIVSEEWTDRVTDFLHVDTYLQKLKTDQKLFGWAWWKMDEASLVMGL